ncbi:MAG TPA: hypothetical protein DHU90_03805 [Sphingobacterium sp.]|nr:hypothetical protein [Sphingobacterium sp.]HCX55699.1 hypothetical protein [Sphingobacterium sp.]
MGLNYFKSRKRFDFSPHPFDVGNILGLKRGYGNNHFLLKIYGIDNAEFEDYYTHHLDYFLSTSQGIEKDFLSHVWYIVQKRIEHFERKDPFSSGHPRHQSNIGKLTEFQQYLGTRDKWNIRPNDVLLKEKDGKIAELEAHIQDLEEQLKADTKYGVSQKVYVEDGYLPTLINLIQQLREVELPNGRKLLKSDHHSPYYKLIAKYFHHGGKEIPLDTAHNYFVGKGEAPIKGLELQ